MAIEMQRRGPVFLFVTVMTRTEAEQYRWADKNGKLNKITGI